jgi:hypothetical protein
MMGAYLTGYAIYIATAARGTSRPNIATWGIFSFLAFVNAFSYFELSSRDVWLSLLPLTGGGFSIATFFLIARRGTYSTPTRREGWVIALGIAALCALRFFQDAATANFLVQVAYILAFLPTLTGVHRDPKREHLWPWFFWLWAAVCWVALVFRREFHPVACMGPLQMFAMNLWMFSAVGRRAG